MYQTLLLKIMTLERTNLWTDSKGDVVVYQQCEYSDEEAFL